MDQVVRKLSSGDSIWSTCGLGKTVRERLAEIAQVEAERIATVYLEAMEADRDVNPDDRSRVRAADAFLAQAFGRPPLSIEVDKETEETIIIASPILSRLKGRRRQSGGSSRRACAASRRRVLDYAKPGSPGAHEALASSLAEGFRPAVSVLNLDRLPHGVPSAC